MRVAGGPRRGPIIDLTVGAVGQPIEYSGEVAFEGPWFPARIEQMCDRGERDRRISLLRRERMGLVVARYGEVEAGDLEFHPAPVVPCGEVFSLHRAPLGPEGAE